MPWSTFTELTKQVHLLHDIILGDMVYVQVQHDDEAVEFAKHLFSTKNWFTRISAPNKKRFLLALLQDINSAWAVSRLLLCIWNCRTKDAVLSSSEYDVLSSYDKSPMDHNRTAIPVATLTQVMKSDRKWFLSLEPVRTHQYPYDEFRIPYSLASQSIRLSSEYGDCKLMENQALVICELLTVSGGPVMQEILQRASVMYDRYRKNQLENFKTSDPSAVVKQRKSTSRSSPPESRTKGSRLSFGGSKPNNIPSAQSLAQKQLNAHLAEWDATIKSMKDSLNLKEMEVTFNDGTKTNIWQVRRTNPEDIETVDFVQLLPSAISKRILSYLPPAEFPVYCLVNKYWAWLVEDLKNEMSTRIKLNADIDKLKELVLRNDSSIDSRSSDAKIIPRSVHQVSLAASYRLKTPSDPIKTLIGTSVRSAGAYSFKHFISEKLNKQGYAVQIPIRNMENLSERLNCRGALDENLWAWCENILKQRKGKNQHVCAEEMESTGGVMVLGNVHFPCPLMTHTLKLPLNPPLVKDFTTLSVVKPNRNVSNSTVMRVAHESKDNRLGLWSRNLSRFYHATKIPSYCKIGN